MMVYLEQPAVGSAENIRFAILDRTKGLFCNYFLTVANSKSSAAATNVINIGQVKTKANSL